jgi:hypothetical protein
MYGSRGFTAFALALASTVACTTEAGSLPTGRFASAPNAPIAVGPMAGRPAVGDLNRDRKPDLVVACGTCCGSRPDPKSGHVVVLLGDGKGGFEPANGEPVKIASSVRKVALGDFDRDGDIDVAAAQHDSYEVVVLLNKGDGTLVRTHTPPVGTVGGGGPHTHDIAVGDVNGDASLDILTTNANGNSLSVLLGDGRGQFAQAPGSPVSAGTHPYDALAIRDVNGDGKADVVVPNLMANAISILLGDGRGGFAQASGSPIAVGERPGYVVVGDVNNDGKLDVCATHDDVGMVDVLLGDGTGRFRAAEGSPVRVDAPVWGMDAADVNRDGNLDLALGAMGSHRPVVLLGDGKGGFSQFGQMPEDGSTSPNYAVVADLDSDGRPDIVTGNYGSGDVSVFLGK